MDKEKSRLIPIIAVIVVIVAIIAAALVLTGGDDDGGNDESETVLFDLTVSSNDGGTVTPTGTTELAEGTKQTITITPDSGFEVSDVLLDGESVGAVTSLEVKMDGDHSVEVVFAPVTVPTPVEHTITASAGTGGKITPSGEVKVSDGADQTFTFSANGSYRVSQVTVDGRAVTVTGNSYTFEDVAGDHTISVTFVYVGGGGGGGGSVTPAPTLQSITVGGEFRTEYLAGEEFDDTGMTVTAHYSDKSTKTVTGYTVTPDGALTVGDTQVTVTYQGKTANVGIKVVDENSLESIEITTDPDKMHYFDDQKFNATGMVVSGVYAGDVKIPLQSTDYEYEEKGGTVTVTHAVNSAMTDTLEITRDYNILDVEELKHFRDNVNDGTTYSGETVILGDDIDLENEPWTPIGPNADEGKKFMGTFEGGGHTISNLNVQTETEYTAAGFFGALNGTARNFTIDGAEISHLSLPNSEGNTDNGIAVVAGSIYESGTIEDVTVRNATVEGNRYVGGIAGYVYGSVNGCTVENVDLIATPDDLLTEGSFDNGDKVGGIAGYWVKKGNYTIQNNKAIDVTIKGYRDLGIIVGCGNFSNVDDVSGNIISGTNTITVDQKTNSYGDKDENAAEFVGRYSGTAKSCGENTLDGVVTIFNDETVTIADLDELLDFVSKVNEGTDSFEGKTVVLMDDINLTGQTWTPIGKSAENPDSVFKGTFDGAGHTITGLTIDTSDTEEVSAAGFFGVLSGDVKNLNFVGAQVSHSSRPYLDMTGGDNKAESTNNGIAVVAGSLLNSGSITNVTVSDSTVSGNRYVGGIVGYIAGDGSTDSGYDVTVSRCSVSNITLTATPDNFTGSNDNGDKVGGIVGYLGYEGVSVKDCTASDVTITGYRDMGVIAGAVQLSSDNNFGGFTVDGRNTITVDQSTNGYGEKDEFAGQIVGRVVTGTYTGTDAINGTVTIFNDDTVKISTADELMEFASDVNNGDTYEGKTVVLMNDIDMSGKEWIPIGQSVSNYPSNTFRGTFNGQGFTISNLTSALSRATNNDAYAADGLFGTLCGNVMNVNLDNVDIHGTHYVGAVVGYSSANASTITNCHVTNAVLTSTPVIAEGNTTYDNGDKVGGIIGYMVDGDTVTGCSVTDATITGFRDMGGIVGMYNDTFGDQDSISDCTAKDVTIVQDDTNGYQESVTTLGPIVGRYGGGSVPASNTYENVDIHKLKTVDDADELSSVLTAAGNDTFDTVVDINNDLDMTGITWNSVDVQGYHGAGVVTVNGNNHTILNLPAPLFNQSFAGRAGIVINDLTIADSTIKGTNDTGAGAFVSYVDAIKTLTLTNCHLRDSSVTGTGEARVGGLIGWTSGFSAEQTLVVTVTDCSVVNCEISANGSVGGIIGHAGTNACTTTTVEGCTVTGCTLSSTDDGSWRVGAVVGTANAGDMTITDTTSSGNTLSQTNKTAPEGQSDLYGRFAPDNTGSLTIDGVEIAV